MPTRYRHPGRPTEFNRFLELSKIAWDPVLELLGKEVRFEELDAKPYEFKPALGIHQQIMEYEIDERTKREEYRWLSAGDIVRVHDEMIRVFGGEAGILDSGRIESALDRAQHSVVSGYDAFPTILHKAASLMHDILLYHPFVDGQKRTGISSAFIFLGMNDYLMWSRDVLDEVHFAIHVAKGEIETNHIADWLADRVVPRSAVSSVALTDGLLALARRRGRQCSVCGRFLRIDAHEVKCAGCNTQYKVVINSGLIQRAGTKENGSPKERLVLDFGIRMLAKA